MEASNEDAQEDKQVMISDDVEVDKEVEESPDKDAEDFEDNVASIDNEVAKFDESEMDHTIHFPLLPWLSCFAHSLQLVVFKLNTVTICP